MEPEYEVKERVKEKCITAYRVAAEAGAETRVRVEANAEVKDWDVGIMTDILNKAKDTTNILKRVMVGAKEDTKEKLERSRSELEAEERVMKE